MVAKSNFQADRGGPTTFRTYFPQSVKIVGVMLVVMQALCCEFRDLLSRITA